MTITGYVEIGRDADQIALVWSELIKDAVHSQVVDFIQCNANYKPDLSGFEIVKQQRMEPNHESIHSMHRTIVKDPATNTFAMVWWSSANQDLLAFDDAGFAEENIPEEIRNKKGGSVAVKVYGDDRALVEKMFSDITNGWETEEVIKEHEVYINFSRQTQSGVGMYKKPMSADTWMDIKRNYSAPVQKQLDDLMHFKPSDISGKLLLMHGPPGNGKTRSLLALAREWSSWCKITVALDPERLFGDPNYLIDLMLQAPYQNGRHTPWNMVILEDCSELIDPNARVAAGQGLARLLNVTDGLLGQGQNMLIGITTNEPISKMHPALLREGRCLANIEVPQLTKAEGIAWLGDSNIAVDKDQISLAELYALKAARGAIRKEEEETTYAGGLYI